MHTSTDDTKASRPHPGWFAGAILALIAPNGAVARHAGDAATESARRGPLSANAQALLDETRERDNAPSDERLERAGALPDDRLERADALFGEYDKSEKSESLRAAASLLDELERESPASYDVRWRRARVYQALGEWSQKDSEKLDLFDRAITSGKKAIELAPNRVEGHYWLGTSYGGYGEAKGMLKALSMISDIRDEMQAVIRIDPKFEDAGAYLVLGKIDYELPGLFGGNSKRAIEEYEKGLALAPGNVLMKLYLSDSYYDAGRKDDAKKLLEELMALKIDEHSTRDARQAQRDAQKSFDKHFAKKKRRDDDY